MPVSSPTSNGVDPPAIGVRRRRANESRRLKIQRENDQIPTYVVYRASTSPRWRPFSVSSA
eukprot:8972732-Pyramimonas_sp.AAC.1